MMGEISDMILDGTLDSLTGELIDGESPGYPRAMHTCQHCGKRLRSDRGLRDHIKAKHSSTTTTSRREGDLADMLPCFSINGDAASEQDVRRMASQLMECRRKLVAVGYPQFVIDLDRRTE